MRRGNGLVVVALAAATGCAPGHATVVRQALSYDQRLASASGLLEQGRREEGTRALQELVGELEPLVRRDVRDTEHRFLLAAARALLGDSSEAVRQFESLAEVESTRHLASYNLGQIYQLQKEHEAALYWFQRAANARPDDWRTVAKLVQAFQALGRTSERDRARARLLDLYRTRKIPGDEFCREQFQDGRYLVRVFERFELAGEWTFRYRFELADLPAPGAVRTIVLGSYQPTTELARLRGGIASSERVFHLDGYGPGPAHLTYRFYMREPSYEEVRARVVEILRNRGQPISGTIASPSRTAISRRSETVPRIVPAKLVIDSTTAADARDYVMSTFEEIQRLTPRAAMDPLNRIFALGPLQSEDVGTALVMALADSKRTITIAYTPSFNVTTIARPMDAVNGKGSDAYVYFNSHLDPEIPTVTPDGRVVNQRGRPAFIGLGHELIHALHCVNGTMAMIEAYGRAAALTSSHAFRDESGANVTATEPLEELDTIGIGKHRNGPTENDLRRIHHLPPRGAHSLANVEQ